MRMMMIIIMLFLIYIIVNFHSTRYQCMRTMLFEPDFYNTLANVIVVSAYWLVQVATRNGDPFQQTPPVDRLSVVPEAILENISDTLVMTKRYKKNNNMKFSDKMLPAEK